MRLAVLFLLSVLAWCVAPYWLQEGMFMDGQIYAAVAQNLADGIGSFWSPVYQPSASVPYSEQLPMFMGMESLLFRLLGGTLWTERLFMALAWGGTAFGIVVLHRQIWPERNRVSGWWAVAIWSSAPLVGWGMGNHVQEMWMTPFTIWAVVAMSETRWVWIGAFLIVGAALFKGPQGLFPLAWLPVLGMLGILPFKEAARRFGIVFLVMTVAVIGLWLWDDAREAIVRNASNRLVRTFTQERAVTTAHRLWLLGPLLGQWGVLMGASAVVALIRFRSLNRSLDRKVVALLGMGLCASLPLMVTHEQRDFYLITSLPFVALGFLGAWQQLSEPRSPRLGMVLGLTALVGLGMLPWRRVVRDPELRASMAKYEAEFKSGSAFNVEPELRLNHELAAYAMRKYRWEVDLANKQEHPNKMSLVANGDGAVELKVIKH